MSVSGMMSPVLRSAAILSRNSAVSACASSTIPLIMSSVSLSTTRHPIPERRAGGFLSALRAVYDGPVAVIPGNHDLRPRVYFTRYCPALDDYHPFDLDVLLDFSGHGVILLPDFYPFAPGWIATHGHLGFSLSRIAGNTAMGAARKIGKNVVMGHVHRMSVISEAVGYAGKLRTLTGIETGHMMDVSKASYLKNGWGNWAAGFTVLDVARSQVTPTLIPMAPDGHFVYQGQILR